MCVEYVSSVQRVAGRTRQSDTAADVHSSDAHLYQSPAASDDDLTWLNSDNHQPRKTGKYQLSIII